jgi:CBS domain containing-hemolysin-like protein
MTILDFIVVASLTLICGLYVAAEFALVGVRRSRVREIAAQGRSRRLARLLLPVVEDPRAVDNYIAASQIGITLTSLVLGAYAQAAVAPDLAPVIVEGLGQAPAAAMTTAVITTLLALTLLQMIFSELIPKSIALQHPTGTALRTILPMRWSLRAFGWFLRVLNASGILLLRALRLPHTGHRHIHSPEEIEMLIAESRDGGLLEPDEQVRLQKALRLRLRTARELMAPVRTVTAIDASTPPDEVLKAVCCTPFTRVPVYRGSIDHVVGAVHTRDLVRRYAKHGVLQRFEDLVRPVLRVRDNVKADALLTQLRQHPMHLAIVVDAAERVLGLVTLQDVLGELLGDVTDEFKEAAPAPDRLPDGAVRLPGHTSLEDAALWLGVGRLGEGATIAEFVRERLGRAPAVGDRFDVDGVRLEVNAVENDVVASATAVAIAVSEQRRDSGHG